MLTKLTITIEFDHGYGAERFADVVLEALPDHAKLVELRKAIVPAILPVKFRLAGKLDAFLEFDE